MGFCPWVEEQVGFCLFDCGGPRWTCMVAACSRRAAASTARWAGRPRSRRRRRRPPVAAAGAAAAVAGTAKRARWVTHRTWLKCKAMKVASNVPSCLVSRQSERGSGKGESSCFPSELFDQRAQFRRRPRAGLLEAVSISIPREQIECCLRKQTGFWFGWFGWFGMDHS